MSDFIELTDYKTGTFYVRHASINAIMESESLDQYKAGVCFEGGWKMVKETKQEVMDKISAAQGGPADAER